MPGYLVLLAPSSNRVYAGDAPAITAAEAEIVVSAAAPGGFVSAPRRRWPAFRYLAVELADGVDPHPWLARRDLCGLRAGRRAASPVEAPDGERFDDDLLTIPKYPGKTNEQLTRVLLNVTLASTGPTRPLATDRPRPAGRPGDDAGWALTLGHDAVGVELEKREVDAYGAFLTTWLRRKRLKHRIGVTPLRRDGQRLGDLLQAEIGRDDPQSLVVYAADTSATAELLQRRRVDVIVTDAPYGVAHASRSSRGGRDRSPADLLADALPVWVSVLRPVVPSASPGIPTGWRVSTSPTSAGRAGLDVCDDGPYRGFAHRVDAGIHRDLLVARKPRSG